VSGAPSTWPGASRGRRALAPALAVALAASSAACAGRVFSPPTGPGGPAPEAAARLDEAVARCRNATTFQGQTRLAGRVGDEAISVGASTGVTAEGGIYIEVRAIGTPALWLSGREDRATLWLREDNLTLTEPASAIIEALTGVRLEPSRLLAIVTGCIARTLTVESAAQYDDGELIRVTTPDATVYLRRRAGQWRIVAGRFDGLQVDLVRSGAAIPAELRITSEPGVTPEVDLRLEISAPFRVNDAIRPDAFERVPPPDARLITLEDLRAAGPLRTRDGGA
jgi:hypothetical protein